MASVILSLLNGIQTEISACAREHGWYESGAMTPERISNRLMLVNTELCEVIHAINDGNKEDAHCPGFSNMEIECADAVIRLFSLAGECGFSLGAAMLAKMAYNETRPFRHGGKVL